MAWLDERQADPAVVDSAAAEIWRTDAGSHDRRPRSIGSWPRSHLSIRAHQALVESVLPARVDTEPIDSQEWLVRTRDDRRSGRNNLRLYYGRWLVAATTV